MDNLVMIRLTRYIRLIGNLGLTSKLSEYKVPKEDLPQIAERSLGRANDPLHSRVVKLLEDLF